MKNTIKLKTISASIVLLGLASPVYAQWAVVDPSSILILAQQKINAYNTLMSNKVNAGNGQQIEQVGESVELLQKQSVINVHSTDLANRKALGDAEMGRIGMGMLPSISACAEASNNVPNAPKTAAGAASTRATGGGPNGRESRVNIVTNTSKAMVAMLKDKETLGTCSTEINGAAGCGGKAGEYALGDMHPRGIKGNIKGTTPNDASKPDFTNYTLDSKGWSVAQKYAADSAFYDKPRIATPEQLKKNPGYAALYQSIQNKLYAVHDALTDIGKLKRQSVLGSTVAGKAWEDVSSAEYQKVTGASTKPQKNPSLYDLVNFDVRRDYFGNEKADLKSTEELNRRLAISNFLAWQQYQQQENTNILLAHMLAQMTTPVSKSAVDNEHAKTMRLK